jgi:hypothetical protein|eukprot:SAG25_NODE_821_length_5214_cov_2.405670_2_plen_328_part_00
MATLAAALRTRRAARLSSTPSGGGSGDDDDDDAQGGGAVVALAAPRRQDVQGMQQALHAGLQLVNPRRIARLLRASEALGDAVRPQREALQRRFDTLHTGGGGGESDDGEEGRGGGGGGATSHRVREVQLRRAERAERTAAWAGEEEDVLDGLPPAAVAEDLLSGRVRPEDVRPTDTRPQDVLGRRPHYEPPGTDAVVPLALVSAKEPQGWGAPHLQPRVETADLTVVTVPREEWVAQPYARATPAVDGEGEGEASRAGAAAAAPPTVAETLRARREVRKTAQKAAEGAAEMERARRLNARERYTTFRALFLGVCHWVAVPAEWHAR